MPDFRSAGTKLAVALVLASVAYGVTRAPFLLLVPGEVFSLPVPMVWELLTYGFIATEPMTVIFGALVLVSVGGALEAAWGSRRLLRFALGMTAVVGAVVAAAFAPLEVTRGAGFEGAWVMGISLWVAFGLYVGRGQTNFWGIPCTGHQLAMIGAAFPILTALMKHAILPMAPQLLAIVLTWAYMRGANPRLLWLRVQSWWLQRQAKTRSRHLRVISPERNTPRDSDRYLH
jgi:membrane associated rhomboid family serine protease